MYAIGEKNGGRKMSILFQQEHTVFCIQTERTSYALALNAEQRPVHLYWGPKLESLTETQPIIRIPGCSYDRRSFSRHAYEQPI